MGQLRDLFIKIETISDIKLRLFDLWVHSACCGQETVKDNAKPINKALAFADPFR
jgi:hypothetical protein